MVKLYYRCLIEDQPKLFILIGIVGGWVIFDEERSLGVLEKSERGWYCTTNNGWSIKMINEAGSFVDDNFFWIAKGKF
jgi:hypothetical protein